MVQAAVLDGLQFDASPFDQNGFATTKIVVGRGKVADALVVAVERTAVPRPVSAVRPVPMAQASHAAN